MSSPAPHFAAVRGFPFPSPHPLTHSPVNPVSATISAPMTGQETNDHDHPHARTNLQGYAVTAAQKAELLAAFDKAFDYRGDVTLTLTDGRTVEGYLFD